MQDGIIAVSDPARVADSVPEYQEKELLYDLYARSYSIPDLNLYTPFPETIKGADRLDAIINVRSRQVAAFNGQIDLFAAEVEKLCKAGYRVTIAAGSPERNERIREYLEIAEVSGNIGVHNGEHNA
jgi:hypothetical protein